MTYDPAFMNTAACRSRITYIDGDKGILEYRGYPIEQLAEQVDLPRNGVPDHLRRAADRRRSSRRGRGEITLHTMLHENIKKLMEGFQYDAHPMGVLPQHRRRASRRSIRTPRTSSTSSRARSRFTG